MRTRARAFTLVELLVVVAVIAVLVAMLVPALQRAREQAMLLQCLSNIRQVGMVAMGHYAVDNKGQVTPAQTYITGFGPAWCPGVPFVNLNGSSRGSDTWENTPPWNYNAVF